MLKSLLVVCRAGGLLGMEGGLVVVEYVSARSDIGIRNVERRK